MMDLPWRRKEREQLAAKPKEAHGVGLETDVEKWVDKEMTGLGFEARGGGLRESRLFAGRMHIYREYVRSAGPAKGQTVRLCVAADDVRPRVSYQEQIHQLKRTLRKHD